MVREIQNLVYPLCS